MGKNCERVRFKAENLESHLTIGELRSFALQSFLNPGLGLAPPLGSNSCLARPLGQPRHLLAVRGPRSVRLHRTQLGWWERGVRPSC